jgi:hypothetical protein
MRRFSLAVRVVLLVVSILALTALTQAQYRTSIQGVVTDSTGAVIPGATLTLTNPATNEKQVRTSDANGVFNFNALPASVVFRLEVSMKGFQNKRIDDLQLIPEQPNAVNITLDIGSASQTVNVNGDAIAALDTETASVNGVVTDNQIQHMPSFGRDVTKLVELAPGSFSDQAQGSGGGSNNLPGTQTGAGASGGNTGIFATENGVQAIANGNQTENNGITIDGISTTSAVWGGGTVITPSEDSVESVKVVSNSYDAESGRFSGAQIQVTSKGGSNDVHGSLFFTTHQPNLNAYQRFNGEGNPVLRDDLHWEQFGGSVGGPIWKNKIFAFFNYETVRLPNGGVSTSTGWYDTPAFDGLTSSAGPIATQYLTFPGHAVNSTSISPTATCATIGLQEGVNCLTLPGQGLNLGTPLTTGVGTQDLGWSSPTNPGCGGAGLGCGPLTLGNIADIANYATSSATTSSKAQYNGRLDADVTSNDRLTFSIYWVPQSSSFLNGPSRDYNYFHHSQINEAYSLVWNHTFSPTMLNEARFNGAGWHWNEVKDNPQSPVGLPSDYIGNIGSISPESFGPSVGSILDQWTYSGKDVATKIIGRHTIKFGGEITRLFYLQDCAGCGVPSYNFYNMWDFLNDAPYNESSQFDPTTGFPSTVRQDQREDIWGFFAQDDFKLRKNLTVNLGLRWSYFGPLSAKQGNMFVATPGSGANYLTGLTVAKGHSWNAQKDNFSPELGFAWSPERFHDRLVFRGGFGLNYNQEEIAISANISNNPGLTVSPYLGSSSPEAINPDIIYAVSSGIHNLYGYPANPNTISTYGPNGLPTSGATVGVEIFPSTLPTMRAYHYSFDTQYDIGHQWVMTLGYQGSLSRDIFFHSNPLAIPAASGYALNPQIGYGDDWGVNGRANYNAMLTELKHQFSRQFLVDSQFTWAKSMDTSSAPYSEQIYAYNSNFNYGRSDYDVSKAFKVYGMWQPVIFRGSHGWLEKIAGDWSLSGIFNWHSGFPWSPLVNVLGTGNPPTTPEYIGASLYCDTCGYSTILPAAYLGGAGNSTSNNQFKTGSNYPEKPVYNPATGISTSPYFSNGAASLNGYTAFTPTPYGSNNPPFPGVGRNSFTGPGYRDVDMTISKGFGLPKMPVLGEGARFELRMDAFNVFNNLNFNPTSISNNIANSNFGTAQSALAARVLALSARFSF